MAPPRTTTVFPLAIYYDGSCAICAGEMEVYRRQNHAGRLTFVDISDPAFDPGAIGSSRAALMYELHAIDRTGTVFRGVQAFRAIWQAFPDSARYRFLAALVASPLVAPLAGLVYRSFARIRGFLPKNRAACRNGSCRLGRNAP